MNGEWTKNITNACLDEAEKLNGKLFFVFEWVILVCITSQICLSLLLIDRVPIHTSISTPIIKVSYMH